MSRVGEGLDRLGVFVYPLPHHKKGGFDVIFSQNVDELLGVLIAPGGVEGNGEHFLVPLDTVDGQLPLGRRRPHGQGGVDRCEHHSRRQDAGQGGQSLSLEQK